jgi:hypothetical protein
VGVSVTKYDEWCDDGRMPRGRKIDGVVLWDVQEIHDAWEALKNGASSNNPFNKVIA